MSVYENTGSAVGTRRGNKGFKVVTTNFYEVLLAVFDFSFLLQYSSRPWWGPRSLIHRCSVGVSRAANPSAEVNQGQLLCVNVAK